MASSELSRYLTDDHALDELTAVLSNKMAEECVDHRMAVQLELDDMRRTFQSMFNDRSNATDRLREEQRNASQQRMEEQHEACEQQIRGVLDRCQHLEKQVEKTTSVLQGVCEELILLKRIVDAPQDGRLSPSCGNELPSSGAHHGEEVDGLHDAEPARHSWSGGDTRTGSAEQSLETLQLDQPAQASERPANRTSYPAARWPGGDLADSAPEAASLAGRSDDLESAVGHGGVEGRPTTVARVAEAAGLEVVAFSESIWDAGVFIGCSEIGLCGSLFTALALLVNIAIQIVFCLIVNDSLTPPRITEETVEDYDIWRTTIAHNVKFVDDLIYTSLARKVCEFRDVPMSSGPIEGFSSISEYLGLTDENRRFRDPPPLNYWMPRDLHHWVSPGQLMCCMALTVWFCTVWKEICSIGMLAQGFSLLPSGKTTIAESSDGLALVAVSRVRRGFFFSVIIVRLLVCLVMGVCGAFYLASTISLGDLLLNALALEIVLSLDELAFEVFAPSSIRALTSLIAPLPRPRSPAWRGLDVKPIVALITVNVAVSGVLWFVVRDQVELLAQARSALCDGDLDFIMTVDQGGVVVAYSPSNFGVTETVDITSLYAYRTVRETVLNGVPPNFDSIHTIGSSVDIAYGYSGSRFTVAGRADADISTATSYYNTYCEDMDGTIYWPVITDIFMSEALFESDLTGPLVGNAPFTSCLDVAPFCGFEDKMGVRARQYCPVTCGCDDPASDLILIVPEYGCPMPCVDTPGYVPALASMDCVDWTPEVPRMLAGVDIKDAYFAGLWQMAWPTDFVWQLTFTLDTIFYEDGGCPGLVSFMEDISAQTSAGWGFGNLCKTTNLFGLRPVTAICPVSCGCNQSNDLLCPPTC